MKVKSEKSESEKHGDTGRTEGETSTLSKSQPDIQKISKFFKKRDFLCRKKLKTRRIFRITHTFLKTA